MVTIVLIEDNREIRENTEEILELNQFIVKSAENGLIGLNLAKKIKPQLILCDIMMPELTGYQVLEALKKDPETSTTPFIFFTAKSESLDMEKGLKMGADAYIIKPFDDVQLVNGFF